MKLCTKCNETKDFSMFSKKSSSKDKLSSNCKACCKVYKDTHKEIIAIKQAEYWKNNKITLTVYRDIYRTKNKEQLTSYNIAYKENNKEAISLYNSMYRNTLKGKILRLNSQNKRRTIKKDGSASSKQVLNLIAKNKACFYCKCDIDSKNRHIDHFIPLSQGGLHTIQNLVVSCSTCNLKKGKKMPHIFIEESGSNSNEVYEEDFLIW